MKMHARKFGSLPRVHIYLSAAYTCLVPVFQKCSFRRFRHLLSDDYDDVCNFMGVLDLYRPICILADTEILLNTCLFAVQFTTLYLAILTLIDIIKTINLYRFIPANVYFLVFLFIIASSRCMSLKWLNVQEIFSHVFLENLTSKSIYA